MYTPIFYDERMNVDGFASYSPSAGKPKRLVELLAHYDYRSYNPSCLGRVTPVTKEDLYQVHDKEYIDGLFNLRVPNGFGDCNPLIPASTLWTVGSLLAGARHAIKYPAIPVCSPSSGFHHACYGGGGGFCTANGLMVVAAKLQAENPAFKVAILDVDQHFGDGTEDIIKHRPDLNVLHFTSGASFYSDHSPEESLDFQAWLESAINEINEYKPDLVIYQAGADCHVDDPLGGYLNTQQIAQRDRAVFQGIRSPIVWNLAGGYQRSKDGTIFGDPVLAIHRNTLLESDKSVKVRQTFFESQP